MPCIFRPYSLKFQTGDDGLSKTFDKLPSSIGDSHLFVAVLTDDARYYFMVSKDFDLDRFSDETGFYIVEHWEYDDDFNMGHGIYNTPDNIFGLLYCNMSEEEANRYEKLIFGKFFRENFKSFYPYKNWFRFSFEMAGRPCYALHEYIPISRETNRGVGQRKIANLLFKMKDGEHSGLAAKLLALAAGRKKIVTDPANTVVLPIPASTAEKHGARFGPFCEKLARYLEIENGFGLIEVIADRENRRAGGGLNGECSVVLRCRAMYISTILHLRNRLQCLTRSNNVSQNVAVRLQRTLLYIV